MGCGYTIPREQSTSITTRYTHHNCVLVVPREDGQVMPETCRSFEFQESESDCEVYQVGVCY
jgi:hypothetical protein